MSKSLVAPDPTGQKKEGKWMDIAHTKETQYVVNHAYNSDMLLLYRQPDGPEEPFEKIPLKPAQAYMFRVAAVNSVGVGKWSEPAAFRTLAPGVPGAPEKIRVNKIEEGAELTWEFPLNSAERGPVAEFAVFLAINNKDRKCSAGADTPFQKVYTGELNRCIISNETLKNAIFDGATKPSVIFRIACRNQLGFGPATQVRWLQGTTNKSQIFQSK